ncbi:MAG: aspartyl protease family protein, partial [Candidatus Eiseniibacteriota bacterium]
DSVREAARVLDRCVAALGGLEAITANRTTRSVGHVEAYGLSGTAESWTRRPDQSASATHLGPFTLLEGYDGAVGWRTDPSGKLIILDGRDLALTRENAWFENDNFLLPDRGGAAVRWLGTESDSGRVLDVLEIRPPGGQPRQYAFDSTGLPVRETLRADQQTVISTLSDWRMVGDRRMSFDMRSRIVGMPSNNLRVQIDTLQINVEIDPARFSPPAPPALPAHWLKHNGAARLPFDYRGRHVWLKASINGAPPADFLYDTGASITVIDSAYAARIGLESAGKIDAMGAGSSGGASFSVVKSLRVESADSDGVELADQRVGVLAINASLQPYFWRECAGVLGYSFISQFVNEVDYDHATITLYDPHNFSYQGSGARFPMTLAGTTPVIRMRLDGKIEGDYRLDVGSNSTVDLHGPFVRANALEPGRHSATLEVSGAGFGGEFSSRLMRMKRIDAGPFGWDDPLVSLSGATTGALASEDYAGNVGNHILERFKCTYDYDRHAVYLEPGAKYAERDHFSRSGLQLERYGDEVRAGQVLPHSPASSAGIESGDRVISIEGRPILEFGMEEVRRLFEDGEPGTTVHMEISRNGKSREVKLKLKDLI